MDAREDALERMRRDVARARRPIPAPAPVAESVPVSRPEPLPDAQIRQELLAAIQGVRRSLAALEAALIDYAGLERDT